MPHGVRSQPGRRRRAIILLSPLFLPSPFPEPKLRWRGNEAKVHKLLFLYFYILDTYTHTHTHVRTRELKRMQLSPQRGPLSSLLPSNRPTCSRRRRQGHRARPALPSAGRSGNNNVFYHRLRFFSWSNPAPYWSALPLHSNSMHHWLAVALPW